MVKILSQILIVILAVGLVAAATYLIVEQPGSSISDGMNQMSFDGQGKGTGLHNGQGPQGSGEGFRGVESGGSSIQGWLDMFKNVSIITSAVVLIALIKLMIRRKNKIQPQVG